MYLVLGALLVILLTIYYGLVLHVLQPVRACRRWIEYEWGYEWRALRRRVRRYLAKWDES